MSRPPQRPDTLADAYLAALSALVADGSSIDFEACKAAASPRLRPAIEALEHLSRLRARAGFTLHIAADRTWVDRVGSALALLAYGEVCLVILAATFGSLSSGGPAVFQLATLAVFAASSLILRVASTGNPAARALSFVHLGVAAALTGAFQARPPEWLWASLSTVWEKTLALPGDLVLLVGTWLFVTHFPRAEPGGLVQSTAARLARIATAVALALLVANAWIVLVGRSDEWTLSRIAAGVDRRSRDSSYWSVVFPLIMLALPFALLKLRLGYIEARGRVRTFLAGLAVGFGPVAVLSAAGSSSAMAASFLRRPDVFPVATLLVFLGLWTIPITTGWAVATRKVLPLRVIVGRTLQYSLARTTLAVSIVIPLSIAVWLAYSNRERAVGAFLAEGGGAWAALAGVSLALASFRERILRRLDMLFARRPAEAGRLVAEFAGKARRTISSREIGRALLDTIEDAFGPRFSALLVPDADGKRFVPLVGESDSLPCDGAVAQLLEEDPRPMRSDCADPQELARLLPLPDRQWIEDRGWKLLLPLHGDAERLVGIVCLGPRTSDLPYSYADESTLEALSGSAAAALDVRLGPQKRADDAVVGSECESCGRLYDHLTTACPCGGAIAGLALPRRVAGRFMLVRRVGRGGMGVVYEALDTELNRAVALKTLPEAVAVEVARLRDEARVVATLHHPNLAFVLGLEWVGALPVIVVEFLAGGTLADRLRRGPLTSSQVVALGIDLADGLVYLHRMGILHRDLKPSNVGFTATGQPKLLDFGVAVTVAASAGRGVAGTMLYMPPEALAGAPPAPAFDLWGLGVLLLESWLGHHPLAKLSPERQVSSVEAGDVWARAPEAMRAERSGLGSVLARSLAPDPRDRFVTALEMRSALAACGSEPEDPTSGGEHRG